MFPERLVASTQEALGPCAPARSVWVGRPTPAVRAYLQQTQGQLKKVAFFVTSGGADVAKIVPALQTIAGCKSVASAGFNARELKDSVLYGTRLDAFIGTLDVSRMSSGRARLSSQAVPSPARATGRG